MKAQRRHELQTNELARQLETFPETLKRHASTIMLAITAMAVVFFVMRYRNASAENRRANLAAALITSRQGPEMLRRVDAQQAAAPIEQVVAARNQAIGDTRSAIDTILRDAEGDDEQTLRAEALVAKGDLNWTLANQHPIAAAATQPALALPRTSAEYLKEAEDSYNDVINGYGNQTVSWVSAQMGLAAVAENRGDWASARKAYQAIIDRKSEIPDGFAQVAVERMYSLADLEKPIFMGTYPPKPATTTMSATLPSTQHSP